LYLQLESGAVTTSIMQVSAAAAATVDQGKKKKKKKKHSTTVRSKSPHHVSSSHAAPAPAPAPTDMQLAMISLQQVAHGVSSSNSNSNSSSSNTIPAQQLLQLELNNSSSSFSGCSLQNQNLGSLHHHHPASGLTACLLTTGDPNNNNNNHQDGQQQRHMCPSATTPDDHIIQEQRFSPQEDHMRSHHDAGSSWQSSCEFTTATVSGGCSFNANQLAGSSAAVNQRIEGRVLLQQHHDDHEPAGFMLQQVGIREEQWSDKSNHHHLQTMLNDLPGQQQQVMDSSWWGQKRVKTSQGFGFNMVTSSSAAVQAQPAAANPSPNQLEHGCMMQSGWKTLGPLQPLRSGLEMDNKQAAVVPRDHHQNNSSLTEFTSHCKSMELDSSNMLHESQQIMLTEMRNELPADPQQQTLLSSALTTATTCEITSNPNPRISIARLTDEQALMDFENHFINHSMQNIAAAAAIDEENMSMLHDSPQQQQQLEVFKNQVQGCGQLAAQAGSSVGFLHHGHMFAAAGSCDQMGLEWQGEGLGATCVNDYLLLTSAIHKAQLLDLQLKENQRHNNYTKQSEASPASTHVAVVHESSLHHHHHLHAHDAQMVGHDGSGKSLLPSSSSLSNLIDSHQQQQDHERRIVVASGQDVVSHAAAAAAVQELYFSDQLLLDALAADHHQWFTASSREAYEKKTHHHHDPQQQQQHHHDLQILLPSDKRVFKRSSKGGPRRPNIIKGQWTPEEDRYTFLSLEKCVQV
jgi:hypothetical protein